jgi:hypothetical protein
MRLPTVVKAIAAIVLATLGVATGIAVAAGGVNGFAGSYRGFFMNTIGGAVSQGTFTATFNPSRHKRLDGSITLSGGTDTYPMRFRLTGPNEFTYSSARPLSLLARGVATPFGDGSSRELAGYHAHAGEGLPKRGTLFFLQSLPAANPPAAGGTWNGTFTLGTQQGSAQITVASQHGSAFDGVALVPAVQTPGFPFFGTIGDLNGDGRAPVHAIGAAPGVRYQLDGAYTGPTAAAPSHMQLALTANYADGTVLNGNVEINGAGG